MCTTFVCVSLFSLSLTLAFCFCFFSSKKRLVPFKRSMIAFDMLFFCATQTQLLLIALFWLLLAAGEWRREEEQLCFWMKRTPRALSRNHFWLFFGFFNIELQEKVTIIQIYRIFIIRIREKEREFSILFSLSKFQCISRVGIAFIHTYILSVSLSIAIVRSFVRVYFNLCACNEFHSECNFQSHCMYARCWDCWDLLLVVLSLRAHLWTFIISFAISI